MTKPRISSRRSPVVRSHNSPLPPAWATPRLRPSGENAIAHTGSSCPPRICRGWPSATSAGKGNSKSPSLPGPAPRAVRTRPTAAGGAGRCGPRCYRGFGHGWARAITGSDRPLVRERQAEAGEQWDGRRSLAACTHARAMLEGAVVERRVPRTPRVHRLAGCPPRRPGRAGDRLPLVPAPVRR